MSIEVARLDDADEWNSLIERSPQTTPFHRFEALKVMGEYSNATLHPFCGYKGDEPIGLFPVFALSRGPIRIALSPPPDLKISYLGPVLLNHEKLKRRKAEKRHRRFIEAVDVKLQETVDPRYVHVRTHPAYNDPRPFIWNDFKATPEFTYEVDITPDSDDLFMTFSGDIRSNVRHADDAEYELLEGDEADVGRIINMAQNRHAEQGVAFNVPESFARDLYRALPEGTMRAYICRAEGEFVGGDLTLENDEVILAWQGVADYEFDLPVTDLVVWYYIRQAHERGIERFDLAGANNPRLCKYKAKFNPEIRSYYTLERGSKAMNGVKELYKRFR
ncbi:GNAT family N-acetyltransferase [Natronorubrum tibetense]|uniref:BioF2-like acetyltransferase domain-containing protein n=1 Tax=Natronorubrum tibetense GA33 TaxID=1114856 RepID=L9W954_9EURY|nr:GNAT family N-acetyltransferase [Natronorubrum tibetense]ELY45806.1 hypothetical protein C496_02652 [Natronorubrum tibetense GA33]